MQRDRAVVLRCSARAQHGNVCSIQRDQKRVVMLQSIIEDLKAYGGALKQCTEDLQDQKENLLSVNASLQKQAAASVVRLAVREGLMKGRKPK